MSKLIIAVVASLCLLVFSQKSVAQVTFEERFSDGQPPAVLAHRSATLGGFPENTLGWIGYAIEIGVDVVHVNPQRTADDRYILMHDNTLNRMTDVESVYPNGPPGGPSRDERGGQDYVGDYTLADIQQLSIRDESGVVWGKVPSLDEALDYVDGKILVLLGLKSYEVDSLAAALGPHDTGNLMLFELYYPGTDQSKLRDLAEVTGIGVSITPYGARDQLSALEGIYGQLGPALISFWVNKRGLTPELTARLRELELFAIYSGWAGQEDFALIEHGDPGPWRAVFEQGLSGATDQPETVLRLLGR